MPSPPAARGPAPTPPRPSSETQRLAAQAAAFARGQEADVLAWLERLGCRLVHRRDAEGEWVLDGPSGIHAGLMRGLEPVAVAVQLGLLFAGPFWPVAFPHLVETAERLGRAEAPPRPGPPPRAPLSGSNPRADAASENAEGAR